MTKDFMFTSESVTEGHPDKLCDIISDAIVDAFLSQDPCSRIVAECAVSKGVVFIAARFAGRATVDIPEVARSAIAELGYRQGLFNARDCSILTSFTELPDSDCILEQEHEWNDQYIENLTVQNQVSVFGYACNQTESLMPLPIYLAHRLARRLRKVRARGKLPYLAIDGDSQVSVQFKDRQPLRIHSLTLVTSLARTDGIAAAQVEKDLREWVIDPVFADEPLKPDRDTRVFINPVGALTGGPAVHSGMTGRKTTIDAYGGFARQSGAALSGKDPLRIDRVGAYAARLAAKNIVASGLANECEVQLSYTIGLSGPVSVQVETYGSGIIEDAKIADRIRQLFDFRLGGIIKLFGLRHLPAARGGRFYSQLACYGHMGRVDLDCPWEDTGFSDKLD